MALDWLSAARRAPINGQPGFAWQVACPPKVVWHTTEAGAGIPSYTPGLKAPHATILGRPGAGVDVVQHIPLTLAAYSLVHAPGGAATNGAHAFQFELAGTCVRGEPGYYWPGADDAVLRDLHAKVIKPIQAAYGVQLVAPTFKAYPASYGSNGVRLSDSAWLAWRGHAGHQHIPGNDHGDPGAFPWARLVQLATGDDDMPLTPDDIGKVASAVWAATFGPETAADRLLKASHPAAPAVPTAQDIAAALTPALIAAIKALPAGTATLDDTTIAKVITGTVDEISKRLVK